MVLFTTTAADPILAPVIMLFIITGIDDKRYEMLCLPWSHWHSFWLPPLL